MRIIVTTLLFLSLSSAGHGQQQAGTEQLVEDILREVVDQTIDDAKEEVRRSTGIDLKGSRHERGQDREYWERDDEYRGNQKKHKNKYKRDTIARELQQLNTEHERKIIKLEEELKRELEKVRREFRREAAKEDKRGKVAEKRRKLEKKVDKAYRKFAEKMDKENRSYAETRRKILTRKQ